MSLKAQGCIVARYIDKLTARLTGFADEGSTADMGKWYI